MCSVILAERPVCQVTQTERESGRLSYVYFPYLYLTLCSHRYLYRSLARQFKGAYIIICILTRTHAMIITSWTRNCVLRSATDLNIVCWSLLQCVGWTRRWVFNYEFAAALCSNMRSRLWTGSDPERWTVPYTNWKKRNVCMSDPLLKLRR